MTLPNKRNKMFVKSDALLGELLIIYRKEVIKSIKKRPIKCEEIALALEN